ncbi:FtsX-like permease family protein, partial [Nocardioides hankookensis]
VAAVAATVAGVVALGIAVTSDEAQNRETYRPELPAGMGSVSAYVDEGPVDWTQLRAAVADKLPDAHLVPVHGLIESSTDDAPSYWLEIKARDTDEPDRLLDSYGTSWGASTLVGESTLEDLPIEMTDADREAALRMLRAGGVVAFTDQGVETDHLQLDLHEYSPDSSDDDVTTLSVPAVMVPVALGNAGPQAILSTEAAKRLGAPTGVSGLVVSGPISRAQEEAVSEALAAADTSSSFYVERGYQTDNETMIVQLVLAALGGVLMLGGTLTATFLALSDARPDLATLSAVGASPRRRRWVAASYALVIGFVGAVLGAAVGFIPGVAITYPLTSGYSEATAGHYLDVPWLMILGLVVVLPLLTALIVGLTARSRLPLVARLD